MVLLRKFVLIKTWLPIDRKDLNDRGLSAGNFENDAETSGFSAKLEEIHKSFVDTEKFVVESVTALSELGSPKLASFGTLFR